MAQKAKYVVVSHFLGSARQVPPNPSHGMANSRKPEAPWGQTPARALPSIRCWPIPPKHSAFVDLVCRRASLILMASRYCIASQRDPASIGLAPHRRRHAIAVRSLAADRSDAGRSLFRTLAGLLNACACCECYAHASLDEAFRFAEEPQIRAWDGQSLGHSLEGDGPAI